MNRLLIIRSADPLYPRFALVVPNGPTIWHATHAAAMDSATVIASRTGLPIVDTTGAAYAQNAFPRGRWSVEAERQPDAGGGQ